MLLPGNHAPQQAMQLATPLNDIQLVALMAAHIYAGDRDGITTIEDCVRIAKEIVAEAILNGNPMKINEAKREREEASS